MTTITDQIARAAITPMKLALALGLTATLGLVGCGGGQAAVAGGAAEAKAPCPDCGKTTCAGKCDGQHASGDKAAKPDCQGEAGKEGKGDCDGKSCPKRIAAADVQQALTAGERIFVYDVNGVERFNQGHIKGAHLLNRHTMTEHNLPTDKASKLVFYCGSSKCKASVKAAKRALALGYTNVWVMPEGIAGWESAGLPTEKGDAVDPVGTITPADLQSKRQGAAQVHIFDVNSAERFAKGHVPGARLVTTAPQASDLPANKDAMLVFYCANSHCSASHKAAAAALALGYTKVFVMKAGIAGWEEQKLPVETAAP